MLSKIEWKIIRQKGSQQFFRVCRYENRIPKTIVLAKCGGGDRVVRFHGVDVWIALLNAHHWAIFIWRPIIVAIIDSVLQRIIFDKFAIHSNATFYFCHRFLFNILHIRNFGDFIIFDIRANKTWLNFFSGNLKIWINNENKVEWMVDLEIEGDFRQRSALDAHKLIIDDFNTAKSYF